MLTNFKDIVKHKQQYLSDIFLIFTIIFVALSSFGAGWLMAGQEGIEPITIKQVSSIEKSAINLINKEIKQEEIREKKLIGSINSNKYHHPDCPWAKKIASKNQIWFNSEEEAQEAGYIRGKNFEKYINN